MLSYISYWTSSNWTLQTKELCRNTSNVFSGINIIFREFFKLCLIFCLWYLQDLFLDITLSNFLRLCHKFSMNFINASYIHFFPEEYVQKICLTFIQAFYQKFFWISLRKTLKNHLLLSTKNLRGMPSRIPLK